MALGAELYSLCTRQGAPRRFTDLPSRYDSLTYATIPLIIILALALFLFVWNIVQSVRGKGGRYTATEPDVSWALPRRKAGSSPTSVRRCHRLP